jgi:hypothetical protein
MRLAVFPLAVLAWLLLTPVTAAAVATLEQHDVVPATAGRAPVPAERAPAAVATRRPFQLLGLHWRGPGTVRYRVLRASGWSAWLSAERQDPDSPDRSSPEATTRPGWIAGEGVWVGDATRVEVRRLGVVSRVRVFTVRSPSVRLPLRRTQAAGRPDVVPRGGWLANEAIRRGTTTYAPAVRFAIVHHTAGANTYTREQAPAIVRAIQLYHVQANGWNDIGYNALVDRFGTVYEGRYGGLDRNVVGAHARGFNTGSFGIAYLGNFDAGRPERAGLDALARTLAWRLDLAHVDPLSSLTASTEGNERFGPGTALLLRAVSGHRDTGATSCPGDFLYLRLGEIARAAAAIGLPKLYEPRLDGRLGGPVRFRARLSGTQVWTVTVTDGSGVAVAEGRGSGPLVDWTWQSAGAPGAGFRWRIAAAAATPATGSLGAAVAEPLVSLSLGRATATPPTISPNGDGQDDETTIAFALSAPANVSATVVDSAGAEVATLAPARWRRAGDRTLPFDGLGLPDGAYVIRLLAKGAGGAQATAEVPVAVSRTLGGARALPGVVASSSGGGTKRLAVSFSLNTPATVRVRLLREGRWVATAFAGELEPGARTVLWDGRKRVGRARDGGYEAIVDATDAIATTSIRLPFLVDTTAPRVTLRSARAPVALRVSEPARLTVRVNGALRRLEARGAGDVVLRGIERVRTLVVVARDAAGNRSVLRAGGAGRPAQ